MLPEDWKLLLLINCIYTIMNFVMTRIKHHEIYPVLDWKDPWQTFGDFVGGSIMLAISYNILARFICRARGQQTYEVKKGNLILFSIFWITILLGTYNHPRFFIISVICYPIHLWESFQADDYYFMKKGFKNKEEGYEFLKSIIPLIRLTNELNQQTTIEPQEWKDESKIPQFFMITRVNIKL